MEKTEVRKKKYEKEVIEAEEKSKENEKIEYDLSIT